MYRPYAIFDMDGTLVDSMRYWKKLGREYLLKKGITENIDDVLKQIETLTMTESAMLFQSKFNMKENQTVILNEMNALMALHYQKHIPLKPGVKNYLEKLSQKKVSMCVASSTDENLMEQCLQRLEVKDYFSFLISCESIGVGKNSPEIYHAACRKLGATKEQTVVYEDALFAAKTAKEAGYYVIGVYDKEEKELWEKMKKLADETIYRYNT